MQCPPRPGPGTKRMKPYGFGRCRVQHLPDIQVHPVTQQRQFVYKRDRDDAKTFSTSFSISGR